MPKGIMSIRNTITIPEACREFFVDLEAPALAAWRHAGIDFAGCSRLVHGYRIAYAELSKAMVIATADGAGQLQHAGYRGELVPGDVIAVPPGGAVHFAAARRGWRIVWWYAVAGSAPFDPGDSPQLARTAPAALWYEQTLRICDARGDVELRGRHAELQLADLRAWLQDPRGADEDAFARLWRRVDEALHEDWPVARLAAAVGYSPVQFQRLVRARYGTTAHRLVVDKRIDRAKTLLRNTDYPLRVIAARVGYRAPFTFSNAFKQALGWAPSRWRRDGGGGR